MIWGVLPVKDLDDAKQRLSAALSPEERRGLFRAMVEDVMAALAAAERLAGVLVVTRHPEATALAARHRFRILEEPENEGHTAAVTRAADRLKAEGAAGMLQVPGDIPLVTGLELDMALAAHDDPPAVTIVPSRDYMGSNCVIASPPDVLPLRFGDDSFYPHMAKARELGIEPRQLELPGIGLDVDTPEDLAALLERPGTTRTHSYLSQSGIAARLRQGEDALGSGGPGTARGNGA